jgi:steroid delta-isomerase-like uncharacterized protein
MNDTEAIRLMEAHAAAWNAHDIDALLAVVTEDCVFDAAAGRTPSGERHVGHDALRKAFASIWETFPDAQWTDAVHSICGNHGVSVWTFRGTRVGGQMIEARGLDLLWFREGRICHKDTFRKNVLA